jgi:cell wall-associated NlpC family hydrolase
MSVKTTAAVVVVVAVLMAAHGHDSAPVHGSRQAVAYAREQLGKPYEWGGTGPGAFDCSGLTMQAWASAGVSIPRTAAEQFAQEPRVAEPRPGDEVFFAGADGTPSEPGHVGLVIGRHLMIEAYATGYPIRISHFGTASSPPGDGDPVGYADPGER